MKKYLQVFLNSLAANLEYRSEIVSSILLSLIPLLSMVIFWLAVFRAQSQVGGLSLSSTIAYYSILPLIGFITSCSLSSEFGYQIKRGDFSQLLLKPFSVWAHIFSYVTARKVSQLILILPVYALVLWLLNQTLLHISLQVPFIITGLVFCVAGYLLNFTMEIFVTWFAFWIDEVWSLRHFKEILFGVLGGQSFPYSFLSASLQAILSWLPFQYFFQLPASYFLGQRSITNIPRDLLLLGIWSIIFLLLSSYVWQKGLKKYGAFGN